MPSAGALEIFERRLVELGCPPRALRERAREWADHCEDLKLAALEEGLSETEAAGRARERMGNPVRLAEEIVSDLRQSCWLGRHPFIGLCLCPTIAFVMLWPACGYLIWLFCQLLGTIFGSSYNLDEGALNALSGDSETFGYLMNWVVNGLDGLSCAVLIGALYWLAQRSALSLRWKLAACAGSLAAGFCAFISLQPHNITVGLGLWHYPDWPLVVVPLLAAFIFALRQRRLENQFAPIPKIAKPSTPSVKRNVLRPLWRTPTYWITAMLAVAITVGILIFRTHSKNDEARMTELKNHIWPAERAAALARLQRAQNAPVAANQIPVNLKPWLNETLATSSGSAESKENNLAALPMGIHTFAGLPFDVEGRAQLCGQVLLRSRKKLPGKITNIHIGKKCSELSLLHGACDVHEPGKPVAKLILHYNNGAREELKIVAGEHLLDWWGPIYETDADEERHTTATGTELAWAGSNPWIRQRAPEFSLRLYKSTFTNPHPDLEITSVDYASTLSDAAPFLVGLTVKQTVN